jgi:glucose/arabinose dehydrogenase
LIAGLAASLAMLAVCALPAQELEVAFPNLSFRRPVDLQDPDDRAQRLFVVEQEGIIRVFENRPQVASTQVFLDIVSLVDDRGNEEGLLGLAFHPRYRTNGTFYVNYTAAAPERTVIARYRVDSQNPFAADPSSAEVVLEFEQPYSNHNGGQLAFGPDGCLYIAVGDGGSGGDPHSNGQDRTTILGSILRIDVDRESDGKAYAIPPDNPFADNAEGFREEIFAFGLRNPWRFSFDPPTGRLWAADVGQNRYEEIDIIRSGGNYGWNIMEGRHCYGSSSCDTEGLILPVWEYGHSLGRSVTGGFVYRGQRLPWLQGAYVYADYVSGRIWSLREEGNGSFSNRLLLDSGANIASFGTDWHGELYLLAFDGRIYRFR